MLYLLQSSEQNNSTQAAAQQVLVVPDVYKSVSVSLVLDNALGCTLRKFPCYAA